MALRTRIKRAFTRSSSDEDGRKKGSSKVPKTDSHVYQPGEKMPPLKYRRPVAPEHKAKLEAFNWANAWRRRSAHSVYSPMGSRIPSRKASYSTLGRRSIGGRSLRSANGRRSTSRSNDVIGVDSGFGGSVDESRPERVREGSDEEGDVTNVGLSRHPTQDPRKTSSAQPHRSKNDAPFSPEELELALKRSHLESPKEESDRSGDASPGAPTRGPASRPREVQFAG